MVLIIEIGNTNVVLGFFQDDSLSHFWRLQSDVKRTSDEYLVSVLGLLRNSYINPESIEQTILASVVTPLIPVFQNLTVKLTGKSCHLVDWTSFPSMPILTKVPQETGIDRLINAFAGFDQYRCPLIIIDCGTATTFDVVSAQGEYLGGVISPGLVLSLEALSSKAFQLPRIKLERPPTVIGQNTVHSMQSGIIYGYAGMVDSMIGMINDELGCETKVIATGGLARLIRPVTSMIDEVIEDLTLRGLYLLSKNLASS